ncbi:MAG: hypothetical protein BroJett018_50840 [Chloroflexota bacterium]|nr:MAG: hypothetical protein BroJett018_50840 [Chloroflexota bacterium]
MKRFFALFIMIVAVFIGLTSFSSPTHAQQDDSPLIYDVRWSGQWIGAPSTDGLWLFDTENPDAEPLHFLAGHAIPTLAFDPIRPRMAAFDDTTSYLRILDLETGESIEDIYIETPAEDFFPVVYDIQYSDDGKLLVVTTGARIHVFDAASSSLRDSFYFPGAGSEASYLEWVASVDFGSESGEIIAGNINKYLLFFNIASPDLEQTASVETGVYRLEVIPNTEDILVLDQAMRFYSGTENTAALLDPKFEIGVYGFDLTNAGDLVAVGMDGTYILYSLTDQTIIQEVMTNNLGNERVFGLAFNDDGTQLVTLDTAGSITVWDVASGEALAHLGNFTRAVSYKWG